MCHVHPSRTARSYRVGLHDYGLRIDYDGPLTLGDALACNVEIWNLLAGFDAPVGLLLDRRGLAGLQPGARTLLQADHSAYRSAAIRRAVVVVDTRCPEGCPDALTDLPALGERVRILDAARDPDWEATAHAWLTSAREPAVLTG